jgi:hypothetical protein
MWYEDPLFCTAAGIEIGIIIWFCMEWFFRGPPVRRVDRPRRWISRYTSVRDVDLKTASRGKNKLAALR